MKSHPPGQPRRWVAGLILALFTMAVAGAAAVGWWYARDSPAHQGPIVLISIDGVPAAALPAYGARRTDTPAIDALAAEAVVFDRAYAHSPLILPAHASILSGQLPPDHGVRDDAGFALPREVQTLAEMLRSRGFATGAAVSSFLLRPESGVAQGFTYFNAELPPGATDTPTLEREGAQTIEAAERWVQEQDNRRFFLFVQVDHRDADVAVTRLLSLLKARELYDEATVVLIGDRGDPFAGLTLDDATLRIPLLVKQPDAEGAGRRIGALVQQIDLVPTILDLVRAPVPGSLRGRSLRTVLDDADARIDEQPVYSESLAAAYRFGGHPLFALTSAGFRYLRGEGEDLVSLAPRPAGTTAGEATEAGLLRQELDRLLAAGAIHRPEPIAASDEERYALFGYLPAPRLIDVAPTFGGSEQPALVEQHRAAALLIGQKKYSAGIRALQRIAGDHPDLPVVHYQIGTLLVRTGRLEEAIGAFRKARDLQPEAPDLALALADALVRAGQADAAQEQADEGIALAHDGSRGDRGAAYEMAARVALARRDYEAASRYAEEAHDADPTRPVEQFVRGRILYEQASYAEAATAFDEAVEASTAAMVQVPDLHLFLGESLAHLDRYADAEKHYREELRAFPRNVQAYASLAMLYRASNRDDAVEDVLNELVSGTPTPEGYAVAARLWTILGERTRAEALRSDARARFRGDPLPALLGRDVKR
jgi:arylsulfatase A-like enzyme/predicted negative regulator of RcsB-dependent stress response